MRLLYAVSNARRPLLVTAGALLVAVMPSQAQAERAPMVAPDVSASDTVASDTTSVLAWAGRVTALRRALAEAEVASAESAPALAATAFAEARLLAEARFSQGDATTRALLLSAQALYERHHGLVAPAALAAEELTALRGDALAALAESGPVGFGVGAAEEEPAAPAGELIVEAPVSSTLLYPAEAEALVARERARLLRIYGGTRGLARRTSRYGPMIAQALAQRGVPAELRYLPLIESSFDPGAVSEAGAVGLWQFLPETGAMYGLDSLALHHPTRSTRAAARHLAYLGRLFDGDWQLVLAAYNCGQGRVQTLVRQHARRLGRRPTFWDLYQDLPAETRDYVPRFIALARALETPA